MMAARLLTENVLPLGGGAGDGEGVILRTRGGPEGGDGGGGAMKM